MINGLKQSCKKIVNSSYFNNFILLVILINAIVIGLETYTFLNEFKPLFFAVNMGALLIFIIEALIKITAVAPFFKKYFFNPWDLFDFIVVVLALIPGIGFLVTVARLARLLRVLRVIRQFSELKMILNSLARAIPSISNVLILLVLLFYVYGILGVHLFTSVDSYRWGTLGASILTLFTVVTLTNWDIVFYKTLQANPYAWIYFFSFVFFGSLMIINLFVGVMVHNITESKKKKESTQKKIYSTEKILNELKEIKEEIKEIKNK
jgi:voltage-gated sodium channel